MSGRLWHLWPEGIAGHLGLLLLGGFGVFAIVAGLLYLDDRRERMTEVFARTLSVRTVETVELLEDTPVAMVRRMQTVLSDRRLRVRLLPGRPQEAEWQPPERIDADVARHLERLRPRTVLMRSGEQSVDGREAGRACSSQSAWREADGRSSRFALRAGRAPGCSSGWGWPRCSWCSRSCGGRIG